MSQNDVERIIIKNLKSRDLVILKYNTSIPQNGIIVFMMSIKDVKKQKGFLQIVFVIIFAFSFVLVILENIKVSKEKEHNSNIAEHKTISAVLGVSTSRKPKINDYNSIVKDSLIVINKNVDLILQDQIPDIKQIRKVYNNLLIASVPSIFQELHFNLINITKEMLKANNADKDYLSEQRAKIFKEYPWLSKVIQ